MWVSPGVPAVRAQLAQVSADIARRYTPLGLRGIHLDRIRYSSNQVSYDPETQEAFRQSTGAYPASNAQAMWLDARRGYVNQAVREVYDAVRAVNPSLVLSAAVFPGYKPRAGWSAQWSFTDLFQDPQAWAEGGYLDVELPMNYPATATSTSWTVKAYCSNTDWACVMDDHIQRIERQAGRHVYVGVGAISVGADAAADRPRARPRRDRRVGLQLQPGRRDPERLGAAPRRAVPAPRHGAENGLEALTADAPTTAPAAGSRFLRRAVVAAAAVAAARVTARVWRELAAVRADDARLATAWTRIPAVAGGAALRMHARVHAPGHTPRDPAGGVPPDPALPPVVLVHGFGVGSRYLARSPRVSPGAWRCTPPTCRGTGAATTTRAR
jgi:hypothetical protein